MIYRILSIIARTSVNDGINSYEADISVLIDDSQFLYLRAKLSDAIVFSVTDEADNDIVECHSFERYYSLNDANGSEYYDGFKLLYLILIMMKNGVKYDSDEIEDYESIKNVQAQMENTAFHLSKSETYNKKHEEESHSETEFPLTKDNINEIIISSEESSLIGRQMYSIKCSICGIISELPFDPTLQEECKDFLCSQCYASHKLPSQGTQEANNKEEKRSNTAAMDAEKSAKGSAEFHARNYVVFRESMLDRNKNDGSRLCIDKSFVPDPLEEEIFVKYLNENTNLSVRIGDMVTGTVVAIGESEIVLDIGSKYVAYLNINETIGETTFQNAGKLVKVGDTIDAIVISLNDQEGIVHLSMKRLLKKNALKNSNQGHCSITETGDAEKGDNVSLVPQVNRQYIAEKTPSGNNQIELIRKELEKADLFFESNFKLNKSKCKKFLLDLSEKGITGGVEQRTMDGRLEILLKGTSFCTRVTVSEPERHTHYENKAYKNLVVSIMAACNTSINELKMIRKANCSLDTSFDANRRITDKESCGSI